MDKKTVYKANSLQKDIDELDSLIKRLERINKKSKRQNKICYSIMALLSRYGPVVEKISIPCGLEKEMIQCLIINARNLEQAYEADLKDL